MPAGEGIAPRMRGVARSGVPTLVLMHFLGGSTREWDEVIALLGEDQQTVALDLPGFGDSAGLPGYTVEEMADAVDAMLRGLALEEYVLVGHSMSGKVAAVLARRAEDGGGGVSELRGLILIAPSPPGEEPMTEEKRHGMIGLLGERHGGEEDWRRARAYITKNELRDLKEPVEERAIAEVLRMNRTAWVAWVERGSREDWSERVGVLELPTLIVAGEQDEALGSAAQARVTLPHFRNARLVSVKHCSHLIPMEKPEELAELMREFVGGLVRGGLTAMADSPEIAEGYRVFLASERVSEKTRAVMAERVAGPTPVAGVLNETQRETLRAMLARVVPQGARGIDLAGYVIAKLAAGKGDGWRFDTLPEDAQAYREGLDRLGAGGFGAATSEGQDAALRALADEKDTPGARWFEEVRGAAAEAYAAHPATLARMGYSGLGVGGPETPYHGYVSLGPNAAEAWEPVPEPEGR